MPRVAIQLSQGAGKPAFDTAVAVTKANPSGYVAASMKNGTVVPTTTFNVKTGYGAHADGVTDDGPHIQAAYNAAYLNSASGAHSTVFFPPGTYYVATATLLKRIRSNDWYGQGSPTVHQAGIILFSGYGATIKYPSASTRVGWLQSDGWPTAQYSTYGNIEIAGFTIDNNWRVISGDMGNIIFITGNGNIDNIYIHDVTTTPKMLERTTGGQNRSVHGIMLHVQFTSRTQENTSYCTDITVEDCTIYGQAKPISILCPNNAGYTTWAWNPVVFDNINILRTYTNNMHHCGSGIHLGSLGSGYRCSVIDCTCVDSDDDLVEIDAFNEVIVSGCTFSGSYDDVMFTWFSYPYKTTTPNYTVTDCHYSGNCEPFWEYNVAVEPNERAPLLVCLTGLIQSNSGSYKDLQGRSWGNYTVSGCTTEYGVTNAYHTLDKDGLKDIRQPSFRFVAPMASLSLTDCDITDAQDDITIQVQIQQRTAGGTLPCTIRDVRWRNAVDPEAYALITTGQISESGDITYDTDVSGLS